MPTLADVKVDSLFMLMKGEPGTRKSTSALSFWEMGKMFWLSSDRKMNALLLPGRAWGVDFNQVEYEDFSDFDKMEKKLKWLQVNGNKYKVVVLDSVTTTGDNINFETMNAKTGQQTKEGGEKGGKVGKISINTLEDYKAESSAFIQILAMLKDIREFYGCTVIIIAHVVGERKIEAGSITQAKRVIITGGKAISGKFPAVCDEVYHFEEKGEVDATKPPKYGLYTISSGMDFARTALPLPSFIDFGDRPLYRNWIKAAMDEMKKAQESKPVTKIG